MSEMGVHSQTVTRYWVSCYNCDFAAEEAPTEEAAIDEARREGYVKIGPAWYCPDCVDQAYLIAKERDSHV